ncbi:MAG: hypothetical protein J5I91_07875 [Bacteroidetes bacterium]|nr:hypothetical protein [Bacteroidota bacterium]
MVAVFFNDNSSPTLTNILISGNKAYGNGGGIYNLNNSNPILTNVTVSSNTAVLNGESIFNYNFSKPKLFNCIILGNNLGIGGNSTIDESSSRNLIQTGNSVSGASFDGTSVFNTTPSEIFVNPLPIGQNDGGDYTLIYNYYTQNTGDNSRNNNSLDLAGNPRIVDNKIDLGAYELQTTAPIAHHIIYVKQSAIGNNDGSSWQDAYTDFNDAINASSYNDTIFVASGTYQPASGQYFTMKSGVKIFGGFAGTETQFNQRNWSANITTLKGNGNSVIRNDNNKLAPNAIIDGFVITNGNYIGNGGGIYNKNVSPTFSNLIISNNQSTSGGGMFNENAAPLLSNILISGNSVTYDAGGIYNLNNASPTLINVTISGNSALYNGGSVYNINSSSPKLFNCIILGNTSAFGNSNSNIDASSKKNLIQTGDSTSGASFDGIPVANTTPSEVFTNPLSPGLSSGGDYTLKYNFYTQNTGDNSRNNNTTDLAGNTRIFDNKIDLGAYERQNYAPTPNIIYVKQNAIGNNDGSSWTNAYTNFQTAIDSANLGEQIWVAADIYQPDSSIFYHLKEGVMIYGGFDGTETQFDQRNWATNITTLNGNWNSVIRNDNNGLTTNTVLDGFVITGANSNDNGGGIFNKFASPTFANLIINNNYGTHGGGIFNENSSPTLSNILISGNKAYGNGGGIYNLNNSSPKLINVTISGNTAVLNGASVFNYNSSKPILYNCIIHGNNLGLGGNSSIDASSSKNLVQIGNSTSKAKLDGITMDNSYPNEVFSNPQTPDQSELGDYSLLCFPANPAINNGNNNYNSDSLDLAGEKRKFGMIDLGAYELHSTPIKANDATLITCESSLGSDLNIIDLTQAEQDINNSTGLTFGYYIDVNHTSLISQPDSFYATNGDMVFVKVFDGICLDFAVINLEVKKMSAGIDSQITCNYFTWIDGNTYTSSNNTATYTMAGGASNGCDSVITLNLTIIPFDISVSQSDNILTANQDSATYQWVDCEDNFSPIIGETNKTFIASKNGEYAVIITNSLCSKLSDCYSVTNIGVDFIKSSRINIYPNPVQNKLYVESNFSSEIFIYNTLGTIVHTQKVNFGTNAIDVRGLSSGVYLIKTSSGVISKFVKE